MIDDDTKAAYREDGVCVLRSAFTPDWIGTVAEGVRQALDAPGPHGERYGPAGAERFFGDLDMWTRLEPFRDFVLNSPAAGIAGEVMDSSSATFLYDQMLVKEPGSQQRTPWHQDQPYYDIDGTQVVSAWIPVDPVPAEAPEGE